MSRINDIITDDGFVLADEETIEKVQQSSIDDNCYILIVDNDVVTKASFSNLVEAVGKSIIEKISSGNTEIVIENGILTTGDGRLTKALNNFFGSLPTEPKCCSSLYEMGTAVFVNKSYESK